MSISLLLASAAWGADCFQDYAEAEFRAHVQASQRAIDVDDIDTHADVMKELETRLPCLKGQLPRDPWAEFLVSEALVRYATDGDWEQPLHAALAIKPDVAVPDYLASDGPRTVASDPRPVPSGSSVFVDGVLVTEIPPMEGLHVVQRLADGTWDTVLVTNGSAGLPGEWFRTEAREADGGQVDREQSPREATDPWIVAGILGGVGQQRQTLDQPGDFLPDVRDTGAMFGVWSTGSVAVAGPIGAFWDVGLPIQAPAVQTDTWVGGAFMGPVVVQVGGGLTMVRLEEGGETRSVLVPQPHVGVVVLPGDLDVGVGGGASPKAFHANARVGYTVADHWRFGVDFANTGLSIEEAAPGTRTATIARWRTGLAVGFRP